MEVTDLEKVILSIKPDIWEKKDQEGKGCFSVIEHMLCIRRSQVENLANPPFKILAGAGTDSTSLVKGGREKLE